MEHTIQLFVIFIGYFFHCKCLYFSVDMKDNDNLVYNCHVAIHYVGKDFSCLTV